MMNAARTLWGFWALFYFAIWMPFIALYYTLALTIFGERGRSSIQYLNGRFFAPMFMLMFGIKREEHNTQVIDIDQNYIIVSNHQSQLDILANLSASPIPFLFLAKKDIEKVPFLGFLTKSVSVMVDRSCPESRKSSSERMQRAIADGHSILLYPEGTRNRTPEPLKSFYDGAFRLAIETQKPLLVQTLVYPIPLSLPTRKIDMWPGKVICYWDVIQLQTDDTVEGLKERVKDLMLNHLKA